MLFILDIKIPCNQLVVKFVYTTNATTTTTTTTTTTAAAAAAAAATTTTTKADYRESVGTKIKYIQ